MSPREDAESRLTRKVRVGRLLEVYGGLLTERQREFVRLHHDEDMSFGEIAREFDVSRQAVHDAVRQAVVAMENYEAGLGLLARSGAAAPHGGTASRVAESGVNRTEVEQALAELVDFRRRLASQGIVYDPEDHARALDSVIERLQSLVND